MTDYQLVLHKRTGPTGTAYEELRRWKASPEVIASFSSGELLHIIRRSASVELQVRVELIAPDGVVIDTYTGPHPDDGPELYRATAADGRRSVASVWAALIAGADPGPVPDELDGFQGDVVEAALHHSTGGEK